MKLLFSFTHSGKDKAGVEFRHLSRNVPNRGEKELTEYRPLDTKLFPSMHENGALIKKAFINI